MKLNKTNRWRGDNV